MHRDRIGRSWQGRITPPTDPFSIDANRLDCESSSHPKREVRRGEKERSYGVVVGHKIRNGPSRRRGVRIPEVEARSGERNALAMYE